MDSDKLSKRKKINFLDEIYDGQNLLITDFSNLDLSNIDLSNIPMEKWEDCIFYNTSFKNTGIKFIPNKLRRTPHENEKDFYWRPYYFYNSSTGMPFCDFSDNDLTYLQINDFNLALHWSENWSEQGEVDTYGCNFSNTGINFLKTLRNVTLDTSYANYDFNDEYWKLALVGTYYWPEFIDIHTIIQNPFLNVPSFRVLHAICSYIREMDVKYNFYRQNRNHFTRDFHLIIDTLNPEELKHVETLVKKCEEFLEYDKQGYGKKLYYKLLPFLSLQDKYEFFRAAIINIHIKNVDFEDIPIEVLLDYEIKKNKFENVTWNYSIKDLLNLRRGGEHFLDIIHGYENKYISFYTPNISYSSWQENEHARKRVSESAITFFTKVYLELSRTCNAHCPFCRNSSFDNSQYNLEKIQETLYTIKNYINAVVIGGGEPTLRLNDVKSLHQSFSDSNLDWHMFSNGSNPSFINDDYIMDNFKLNISRHAVVDEENADIFGIDSSKMMTTGELEKLNMRNEQVTLNAVCFNGGLDSFKKIIDYIKFAKEVGCKKVLIQDLQKELSLGNNAISNDSLCIDKNIFFEVIEYLKSNGYREKYPICATGGYISYILKNKEGFSVTLQRYISKNELEKEWIKSIKRTFDLSIDPNGNLYENWNQTTGLVKMLKK